MNIAWEQLGVTWKRKEGEAIEDFCAQPANINGWNAHYVRGESFQNQRLRAARGNGPLGPWDELKTYDGGSHMRLYRGRLTESDRLITAAWPHAGTLGLWHFRDIGGSMMSKQLVLAPRPPFHVVAANPAVLSLAPTDALVIFEGRAESVSWHLYSFVWRIGYLAGEVSAMWAGANPSLVRVGGDVYLFYSDPEFHVRVAKARL